MNTNVEANPLSAPRSGRKKWLISLSIAAFAAALAYWYLAQQEEEPTNAARISIVEIGSIENTIAAAGSLQPAAQ